MSDKYKIQEKDRGYFVTMTTVGWIDVFTRKEQKMIMVNSLKYCQKKKGTIPDGCLMSDHQYKIWRADGVFNLSIRKTFAQAAVECQITFDNRGITVPGIDVEAGFDDGFNDGNDNLKALYSYYTNSKGDKVYISKLYIPQNGSAKVKLNLQGLEPKDKNFFVKVFSDDTSKIKINDKISINLREKDLDNKVLIIKIKDYTCDIFSDNPNIIIAEDHKGNFLARIEIYSQKAVTFRYKLVFVNIKTGMPEYRTLNENALNHYLNNNSHNQLFTNWIAEPSEKFDFSDIYNILSENAAKNNTEISAGDFTNNIYYTYTGLHKEEKNVHYFFITSNVFQQSPTAGNNCIIIGGVANSKTGKYGALFGTPEGCPNEDKENIAHEFGHLLKLNDIMTYYNYAIPQGSTNNFMDYTNKKRNMWYIFQQQQAKKTMDPNTQSSE